MRVLLFAQLKDAAGHTEITWPDAGALTADQLWQRLAAECPALVRHRAGVRLARNSEYVRGDAVFTDADEVALIPPVSGG